MTTSQNPNALPMHTPLPAPRTTQAGFVLLDQLAALVAFPADAYLHWRAGRRYRTTLTLAVALGWFFFSKLILGFAIRFGHPKPEPVFHPGGFWDMPIYGLDLVVYGAIVLSLWHLLEMHRRYRRGEEGAIHTRSPGESLPIFYAFTKDEGTLKRFLEPGFLAGSVAGRRVARPGASRDVPALGRRVVHPGEPRLLPAAWLRLGPRGRHEGAGVPGGSPGLAGPRTRGSRAGRHPHRDALPAGGGARHAADRGDLRPAGRFRPPADPARVDGGIPRHLIQRLPAANPARVPVRHAGQRPGVLRREVRDLPAVREPVPRPDLATS